MMFGRAVRVRVQVDQSIRFQVLCLNNYNPSCLQRRSVADDPADPTADQVAVWTNHRVMEWLRAVDLSEYAPNMRGSGELVHQFFTGPIYFVLDDDYFQAFMAACWCTNRVSTPNCWPPSCRFRWGKRSSDVIWQHTSTSWWDAMSSKPNAIWKRQRHMWPSILSLKSRYLLHFFSTRSVRIFNRSGFAVDAADDQEVAIHSETPQG